MGEGEIGGAAPLDINNEKSSEPGIGAWFASNVAPIRSFFFFLFSFFCVRDPPSETENPITSAAEEEFHFLWSPCLYSVCISVNRVGWEFFGGARMNVFRSESFVGWNLDEYVQMYVVPYEKVSIKIRFIFDRLFIVLRWLLDAFGWRRVILQV